MEHKPKPGWKPWKPSPEKQDRLEQQPKSRWRPALRGAMRVFAALIAVGVLLFVVRDFMRTLLLYNTGPVVGTVAAVAAIVVLIFVGQHYEWTGFGESSHPKSDSQEVQPGKTLWDWLQLFIVPLALALIAVVWTAAQEDVRLQKLEDQRAAAEREVVEQQAQDEALQAYLDVMKELLLERDLRDSGPDSSARAVANVQTSLILERLDGRRKTVVLRLLTDSHLIDADAPLIETATLALQETDAKGMDLSDTDLSRANLEGANLEGADLSGADLSKADLGKANLSKTNLSDANLSGANLNSAFLPNADLSNAVLIGADLREAYLKDATVTDEQLEQAYSLEGATMPNGQKYEDWLKDREKRQQDE